MSRWLDDQSAGVGNIRRFWYPLNDGEKQQTLLEAFPYKNYSNDEGEEEQVVIELFQEYAERFDDIFKLIGDKRTLTPNEKNAAHEMLKDLKENLDYDCKDCTKREGELTLAVKHYFYPAILKAVANINVAWNSHPIKSNWIQKLGSARIDITHTLHMLKNKKNSS